MTSYYWQDIMRRRGRLSLDIAIYDLQKYVGSNGTLYKGGDDHFLEIESLPGTRSDAAAFGPGRGTYITAYDIRGSFEFTRSPSGSTFDGWYVDCPTKRFVLTPVRGGSGDTVGLIMTMVDSPNFEVRFVKNQITKSEIGDVGSKFKVLSPKKKWRLGEIIEKEENRTRIHYTGFDSSHDEWISNNSGRLKTSEIINVLSPKKKWRLGEIIEKEENRTRIHYTGFDSSHDEWISNNSDRLKAVANTSIKEDTVGKELVKSDPLPARRLSHEMIQESSLPRSPTDDSESIRLVIQEDSNPSTTAEGDLSLRTSTETCGPSSDDESEYEYTRTRNCAYTMKCRMEPAPLLDEKWSEVEVEDAKTGKKKKVMRRKKKGKKGKKEKKGKKSKKPKKAGPKLKRSKTSKSVKNQKKAGTKKVKKSAK